MTSGQNSNQRLETTVYIPSANLEKNEILTWNFQSRLKTGISLETFSLDPRNLPQKRALVGRSLEIFILAWKFNPGGRSWFFNLWAIGFCRMRQDLGFFSPKMMTITALGVGWVRGLSGTTLEKRGVPSCTEEERILGLLWTLHMPWIVGLGGSQPYSWWEF